MLFIYLFCVSECFFFFACLYVHHACASYSQGAERGPQISWNWSCRCLGATVRVLESNVQPSARTALCLSTEPSLQPPTSLSSLLPPLKYCAVYFMCMSAFLNACIMYVYTPCACLVPARIKRGHWVPWIWSFR